MALNTYTAIKSAVADWLAREDISDRIIDFITISEAQIYRDVKLVAMENAATIPLVFGQIEYDLPDRMTEMRNIYVDTNPLTKLEYRTPEQLIIEYPRPGVGRLVAYTIVNGKIKLNATGGDDPVTPNNLVISHWAALTPLSDINPTNWLTTDAPDMLLYGALIASEMYLGSDERMPMWRTAFKEIMASINRREDRKRYSGDSLEIRPETRGNYRQPVGSSR